MNDMYFDKDGTAITRDEWAERLNPEYQRVELTKVGDATISTVWLGLNHNYGDGAPLIFETLVFDGALDGNMMRYATIDEAREGHQQMVNEVMGSIGVTP